MPQLSRSGLRWLARFTSSKTSKGHLRPASKFNPSINRPPPTTQSPPKPKKPRLFFSHRIYLLRETWRDFVSAFKPEFRYNVWKAWWLLPYIPIWLFLNEHCCQIMRIKGPSMTPTLNKDFKYDEPNIDDRVIVNLMRSGRNVRRGDIVAFRSPQDPEKIVIKRVIAIQGDMVFPLPPHPTEPIIIQWGQLWVEGDNEDKSKTKDSNWYGPIPRGLVLGTVEAVVWPLNHFGGLSIAGRKKHPRVLKEAVALDNPEEVKPERIQYWIEEFKRENAKRQANRSADGEAETRAIKEIETA